MYVVFDNVALLGTPTSAIFFGVFTYAFSRIFSACIQQIIKLSKSDNTIKSYIMLIAVKCYIMLFLLIKYLNYIFLEKSFFAFLDISISYNLFFVKYFF